jgi:type VI secretion system protein ImpH
MSEPALEPGRTAETVTLEASSTASSPASSTSKRDRLLDALASRPYEFNFFQSVRLLMQESRSGSTGANGWRPVGFDYSPQSEVVHFGALASHTFPPAEVVEFTPPRDAADPRGSRIPGRMTVSFLGLTGPAGVLPRHYTQAIIDRLRLKDRTLLNFLDLFNHRAISLFYRAWEKHRVPPLLERAQAEGTEDAFTRAVYCLVGLGAPAVRNRLEASDETFLFYSGLFAHQPRNAISLERLVGELFALPAKVLQFQGQWLRLEPSEQTAMPTAVRPLGLNAQLGVTAIAGEAVWSIESKFRLQLGPLRYREFRELMPGGARLKRLSQVVRTYAGPEFDFDVQLVLRREEVPMCQLRPGTDGGPRLGWNTWACSRTRTADAAEAVFVSDGAPSR